ncbi:MAG: DHH family phosphoesterase, partial [Candidatus Hydrogenedens sp.]
IFKSISKNKVKINFRSRSFVDVNKIAKVFGGGGHKRASGTTIEGTLDEVEEKIISFIKNISNVKKRRDNPYK